MSKKILPKTIKGLWFYGLAGSGKTFASSHVCLLIDRSFVIDGDVVRKFVSKDLAYSAADRATQTARIFGIGKIAIVNQMFPIMSSVSMSDDLVLKCANDRIAVIQIKRPFEQLQKVRDLYREAKNVVGVDLPLADLNTPTLENDGTCNFESILVDYVKSIAT